MTKGNNEIPLLYVARYLDKLWINEKYLRIFHERLQIFISYQYFQNFIKI